MRMTDTTSKNYERFDGGPAICHHEDKRAVWVNNEKVVLKSSG
jgi:hypothetical protein